MSGVKILFLDDDKTYHVLIQKFLPEDKYNIDHAYNINEAMNFIQNNQYDILIIDVILKNHKTGLDFLKEIRKKGIETLAIILTSLEYEQVRNELGGTNSFSVVNKNNMNLLEEKIENALKLYRMKPILNKILCQTQELKTKCEELLNFSMS